MVEPIISGEAVVSPTVSLGEAPVHVLPEHRRCAFYIDDHYYAEAICSHGVAATGALYSEDLVREMKTTIQTFIGLWDDWYSDQMHHPANAFSTIDALRKLAE